MKDFGETAELGFTVLVVIFIRIFFLPIMAPFWLVGKVVSFVFPSFATRFGEEQEAADCDH